jgi:hypothetical protein
MNIFNPILQPMLDLSFDIETLDNKISSAPIAIGVQQFCRDTGQMGESFYVEIDIDDAMKYGTVSASTLAWWVQQDTDARKVFDTTAPKPTLMAAFVQLNSWVHAIGERDGILNQFNYWGYGPTFDLGTLEHAQTKIPGEPVLPWCHGSAFRKVRDLRTLMDAADLCPTDVPNDPSDVAHHALSDARWQARAISMAWRKIRSGSINDDGFGQF